MWSELISDVGGDEPESDDLESYEEAANECGADDGHMITVDEIKLEGAR